MRARIFAEENRKWWTLGAVAFGLFMIMLDNTIVNVALPSIQRDLGIGISELEWVFNGYALTFGVLMLTGGKLADLLGRRLARAAPRPARPPRLGHRALRAHVRAHRGEQLRLDVRSHPGPLRPRGRRPRGVRGPRASPAPSDARSLALQERDVRRREHRDAARRPRDVRR